MTKGEIERQVEYSATTQTSVRVYFTNNRPFIFGQFVKLKDNEEIIKKDLVRFVPFNRLEYFNPDKPATTQIYDLNKISHIQVF